MQSACESLPTIEEQQGPAVGKRWYVVMTQPHAETRAVANLEKQDFPAFCARFYKSRRHARRLESVLVPLFPRYVFVQLDLSCDRWRCCRGTRGVAHMIMQGERPQAVAAGVVESLLRQTRLDGSIDLTGRLELGQSVRIAHGPFAGLVGTLAQLNSAGRVRVLLHLLGRSVSVGLSGEALLPAT
ncbi:MAG TPA: transcription termination/antitermination NusG family protein [Lacipirellulaceae bacterium]|nr:transcription termination/antitermination NusG family protein [Lacipirellulaceae bacterium]